MNKDRIEVGDKRYYITFRGNKELYDEFRPIAKETFGSVCSAFEIMMAAMIAAKGEGKIVYQPLTMNITVVRKAERKRAVSFDGCEVEPICKEPAAYYVTIDRRNTPYKMCIKHKNLWQNVFKDKVVKIEPINYT
jgi:hypothetical protein